MKDWPWETVVTINAGLYREKNALHKSTSDGYTPAHTLWESSRKLELTLREVLDICRQCHKLAPFCFYNGNTFVAIGRTMIQDLLKKMPPVKAHSFRSIVGHTSPARRARMNWARDSTTWIDFSFSKQFLRGEFLEEGGAVKMERSRARGRVASNTLKASTGAAPSSPRNCLCFQRPTEKPEWSEHSGCAQRWRSSVAWGLHLDAVTPSVRVRASTTKNGKSAEMRLHPELAAALRELEACGVMDDEPVFKRIPRIERFRRDLIKARIAPADAFGRKAVFHSLRHTFGTNLARGGVASRVAMTLMRHSDRRLTDKVYTDENLLSTWGAIDSLPNFAE